MLIVRPQRMTPVSRPLRSGGGADIQAVGPPPAVGRWETTRPGSAPLVPVCTRMRWHGDMVEHLQREHARHGRPRFSTLGRVAWEQQFGMRVPRGANRPGELGDAIIARIWDLIQVMERQDRKFRFPSQIEMHKVFMAAMLRQIYRDDWQLVADRVLPQYGITHLSQEVLVRTGRQVGKSTAMRMFCAPLMLSLPDANVAVCAPRFGQSANIVNPVKHAVKVCISVAYVTNPRFQGETLGYPYTTPLVAQFGRAQDS